MIRTGIGLLLILLLCPVLPAQDAGATDATPPPDGSGGSVFVGIRGTDNEGYEGKINEYDAAPQGARPTATTDFWVQRGGYYLEADGEFRGDAKDQQYNLDFQANRYFRIRSHFIQYLHRLDHDPLTDLDAAKGGPMVWSEDFAAGTQHAPKYSEFKTDMEFVIPEAEWIKFHAGVRSFQREGHVQARSMSKCSSCHVQSFNKTIDQRVYDVTAGVSLNFEKASIEYEYLNRQFNERGVAPTITMDTPIHPVTLAPVFGSRVSYDNTAGPLPFSQVPDTRKSRHHIKARVKLPKEGRLSGAFTSSNATNKFTGLGVDSWGWNGKFTIPIGEKLQFMTQAKQLDFESDSVFVEIGQETASAGPEAGKTFSERYPEFGDPSFMRDSTRSRNRFSWKGELSANLAKYTILKGGYEFRRLKRDHYEVGQTDTNRLYFLFNRRIRKTSTGDWGMRMRYTLESNQDPFLHHKAALPPMLQPEPSPGLTPFNGTQYFAVYAAREADLTSFPTLSQMVEPTLTWMPSPKFSANVHYRYKNLKNDDLNRSDWKRTVHMPGAELWFAPLERLDFTASYNFHNERSDTLFGIPVYDG